MFDETGARPATIIFDRSVRVTSVHAAGVVGVSFDADDVPSIVSAKLEGMGRATASTVSRASSATPRASTAVYAQLGTILRSLIPRQEQAYADGSTYITSIAKLGVVVPAALEVRIVQATDRGWFATAVDAPSGATCAIGVGFALIGWDEGKPYCSER